MDPTTAGGTSGGILDDLINQLAIPYLNYRTAATNLDIQQAQTMRSTLGAPLPDGTYDYQAYAQKTAANAAAAASQKNTEMFAVAGVVVLLLGIVVIKKVL